MPDFIAIIEKWWKPITAITLAATLLAAVIVWLLPKEYLSVATALPANSVASDKASVFNDNIQELYSSLGTPDELDRFVGTARLDTIYLAVAAAHNLSQHYNVKQNSHALYNAAKELKEHTKVIKTEYGELQLKVWDRDRNVAAVLANDLMQQLEALHRHLQRESNLLVLQQLKNSWNNSKNRDSVTASNGAAVNNANNSSQPPYENLIAQYELMVSNASPALLLVEKARPAPLPDRPYALPAILISFLAGAAFSILTAYYLESRKPA